jgi:hypothetical protein
MTVQWGEEYCGPGCSSTARTRAERERELLTLGRTRDGREVIEYYFGKYTGIPQETCPPAGLLMIQTVLRHEYPSS